MDLLSRLFIFSPMKEKKTFTNVFIRNISGFRARVLLFWLGRCEREWRSRERIGEESR